MNSGEPPWKQLVPLAPLCGRLFTGCAVLIVLELLAAPVIGSLHPDDGLLRAFLERNFLLNANATAKFLRGELYIEPDPVLGWRNRPLASSGNLSFDRHGSRSHNGIGGGARKETRVVFLGDSRMYGGEGVLGNETINAQLEDGEIETLNFASPDYSLDQCFLAMRQAGDRFAPDAYALGVGSNPGRLLACHFPPFYDASVLPRLKPRIALTGGAMRVIVPPYASILRGFPNNPALTEFLRDHDPYYFRLTRFKREWAWKWTPFLSVASRFVTPTGLASRAHELPGAIRTEEARLAKAILIAARDYARNTGAELIAVAFATMDEASSPSAEYDQTLRLLEELRIPAVDARNEFRRHPADPAELYYDDLHFTAEGNRLVADAIGRLLRGSGPKAEITRAADWPE